MTRSATPANVDEDAVDLLREACPRLTAATLKLAGQLLRFDPRARPSAADVARRADQLYQGLGGR
jgi:hypothetical protein